MLKYVLIGVGMGAGCNSCGFALFSRLSRALPIASHCGQVRTNGGGCSDRGTEGLGWLSYHAPVLLHGLAHCASVHCILCSLLGDVLLSFMFQLRNIGLPEFFKVVMCLHVSVCAKLHQSLYFQI